MPARDRIRQVFGQIFAEAASKLEETVEESKDTDSPSERVAKVAVSLEVQLMKYFPEMKAYQNKARSLIFNLKDK